MKELISVLYSLPIVFVLYSCESNDLGNKLTVFEGDRLEDRVIVYCTGYSLGSCKAGIYVVPNYEEHYDEKGNYAEYVENARSDDKWVIAKTIRTVEQKKNYWIINKNFNLEDVDCDELNCDSIIRSNVIGPLDAQQFGSKLTELKISLKF